jgi:hypothetical protein
MARAKRIMYASNLYSSQDFYPIVGGVAKWAYPGGVRIPRWVDTGGQYPPSAMTSDSSVGYTCSASTVNSATYAAWKAFNKSLVSPDSWVSANADSTSPWLRIYLGGNALKNIYVHLYNRTRSSLVNGIIAASLQGSDDGTNWYEIGTISGRDGATSAAGTAHYCTNYNDTYTWFRIVASNWTGKGSASPYCAIGELYIFGRVGQ